MLTIGIFICAYLIAGYLTAQALSVAYNAAQWWRMWLCVLLWWLYVLWAIVGLLIEFVTWAHRQMFPKDE